MAAFRECVREAGKALNDSDRKKIEARLDRYGGDALAATNSYLEDLVFDRAEMADEIRAEVGLPAFKGRIPFQPVAAEVAESEAAPEETISQSATPATEVAEEESVPAAVEEVTAEAAVETESDLPPGVEEAANIEGVTVLYTESDRDPDGFMPEVFEEEFDEIDRHFPTDYKTKRGAISGIRARIKADGTSQYDMFAIQKDNRDGRFTIYVKFGGLQAVETATEETTELADDVPTEEEFDENEDEYYSLEESPVPLDEIRVSESYVDEDGTAGEMNRTADVAIADVDKRMDDVKKLIACIGGKR